MEGIDGVKDICVANPRTCTEKEGSFLLFLRLAVISDTEVGAAICSLTFICCLFPAKPLSSIISPSFSSLNDVAPRGKISHLQAVPTPALL